MLSGQITQTTSPMKKTLLAIFSLAAFTITCVNGQVQLTSNYTQNFDSFGTSSVTWANNSTLTGWTITAGIANPVSSLLLNHGNSTSANVYNYGSVGNSDRSLGYLGGGSNSFTNFYLQIQNNTGGLLTSLDVSYDGRLWRSGGAQPTNSNNTIAFFYATGNPALTNNSSTTGWTSVSTLNYAPTVSVSGGAQPGTATNFSTTISGLSLNQGDQIVFRWLGNDGTGTDAGLAIDNINIVPEPTTWALIGLGSAFMLWRVRSRKKSF
jgi:hypothetical protein